MNCSFNIRYKPRTTRQFTKSDLTVYDSAGNTALNTLTVYGKSEVVNGSIKSAGEGWSAVDLGTLTFILRSTEQQNYNTFITTINNIDAFVSNSQPPKLLCGKFNSVAWSANWQPFEMSMISTDTTSVVFTTPKTITTLEQFQTLVNGVTLAYQSTQGNTIAIKTDDGTGVNGTTAVFETGTPLRGIPDSDIRDVMTWDGSSGEVTKNCGEVDLGTLTWTAAGSNIFFSTNDIGASDNYGITSICAKYTCVDNVPSAAALTGNKTLAFKNRGAGIADPRLYIKDIDYTDATAFKNSLNGVMLVYELNTPTTQYLIATENTSIAGLRTFEPSAHAQNNAGAEMTVDYTIRVPTI